MRQSPLGTARRLEGAARAGSGGAQLRSRGPVAWSGMASAGASVPRSANLGVGQFYGAVASRRSEGGLVLTELRHARAVALPAHDHQCPGIYLWLDGRYQEWVGTGAIEYGPHTAVFHPAALRHRDAIGAGGARIFAIELHGALLERVGALLPRVPVRNVGGRVAALAPRLPDELAADDSAAVLAREGLAYELVAALARHGREEVAPWLRRADEALRSELDRRWSLAELATAADVHP